MDASFTSLRPTAESSLERQEGIDYLIFMTDLIGKTNQTLVLAFVKARSSTLQ